MYLSDSFSDQTSYIKKSKPGSYGNIDYISIHALLHQAFRHDIDEGNIDWKNNMLNQPSRNSSRKNGIEKWMTESYRWQRFTSVPDIYFEEVPQPYAFTRTTK